MQAPVAVSPSREGAYDAVACRSCGARLAGPFCHACGQRARHERLTLRSVGHHAVATAFNLDRGLLHTAWVLLGRPGRVIRDVIAGRTAPYTSPVRYFLICMTVCQVLLLWTGQLESFSSGFAAGWNDGTASEDDGVSRAEVLGFFTDYFAVMTILLVPAMAFWGRWLFRKAGFNAAEHLVLQLYVGGQTLLLWALWAVLVDALHALGTWTYWAVQVPLSLALYAYYLNAVTHLMPGPWWRRAVQMLAVVVLGSFTFLLLIGALVVAVVQVL